MPKTFGVIGCGKMAYALIKGIQNIGQPLFSEFFGNDVLPERIELFEKDFHMNYLESAEELFTVSDVLLLAVKPQQIAEVLQRGRGIARKGQLIISIAAGIKIGTIEKELPEAAVIRVMPNTPCVVGEGVSALAAGASVKPEDLEMAKRLFAATGLAVVLPEASMDAVTALSGGGPAFVFLMAEALINAGIQIGLDANLSRELVVHTIRGSMKIMMEAGEHPAVLREQVCSPGGTTIQGIKALERNKTRAAFMEAVEKAYEKSVAIGNKSNHDGGTKWD